MKGSTLHRSALSKERMIMLENIRPNNLKNDEIPQYEKAKTNELDLLYKNVEKTFINARSSINKTPAAYLLIGFIGGVIFSLIIAGIIAISSNSANQPADEFSEGDSQKVELQANEVQENKIDENTTTGVNLPTEETTYTVKPGDTIDRIATKIYGTYDVNKIEEIQRINNIKDPSKLQLGQVLRIPAER